MQSVLSSGQRLRNITIESLLGEGGMGSVWKGRTDIVDMQVAVKVMHPDLAANEQLRLRFLQEAKAMAKLRHDRIVPLNDFFHDEKASLLVLVMPLMEGRPLEDICRDNPQGLPVDLALTYAKDVLSALTFAHESGILHRDVKPSNVLITKDNKAYIMDFGIAKVLTDSRVATTQTGATIGTPDYMSPEQIRQPDQLDGRSDMYSLGCVLYEMLCGTAPFNPVAEGGERMIAVMTAHLRETPASLRSLNPSIPEELDRIVLKAMSKDRNDRFQDCREFGQALGRIGSHSGIPGASRKTVLETPMTVPASPRQAAADQSQKAKQRPNTLVKVAGGAAVVAMLAVGAWILATPKAPAKTGNEGGSTIVAEPATTLDPDSAISKPTISDSSKTLTPSGSKPAPISGSGSSSPLPKPDNSQGAIPEPSKTKDEGALDEKTRKDAQEAADKAAKLKAERDYCGALIDINTAVRLSPQNKAYLDEQRSLKASCEIFR